MTRHLASFLLAATVAVSAPARAFSNLDFEAASVGTATPPFGFIDWSLAAPGWGHSAGADTGTVYYGLTHVGQTQWFLLVDAATQPGGALAGNYSLRFVSGYATSSPGAPWVNAYLSQSGIVPGNASSLTLLASGPLAVSVNGVLATLVPLGGLAYAVDVSPYAGSAVEIRFINTSLQQFDSVNLDSIAFSTSPVPEPAAWQLWAAGAVAGLALRLARKVGPGIDRA
jgi:hypothetical protein